MRKEIRREERIRVNLAGQLALPQGSTVPVTISDISLTGMRIRPEHNAAIDEEVNMVIEDPSLPAFRARIVWWNRPHKKRPVEYGLKFIFEDRASKEKLGTYIENKLKALTERDAADRRKFLRIKTAFTAVLRDITCRNRECKGIIKDLSLGGMSLMCREDFSVGDKIKYSFPIQGETSFETIGEVVSKTEIRKFISYGIKFLVIPYEKEVQLKNYISMRIESFRK